MDRLNRISSVTQLPTVSGRSSLRKVNHTDSAFATLLTEKTLDEERRRRKKQQEVENNQSKLVDELPESLNQIHPENWGEKADISLTDTPIMPQVLQSVKHKIIPHNSDVYKKLSIDENEGLVLERKEEVRVPVRLPSERTMPLAAVEPLVDKKI